MSELKEVYLDLTPNRPKTERTREDLGNELRQRFEERLPDAVERIWDLPPLVLQKPRGEYVALLVEARELYVEGHFYPCVAMCGIVGEWLVKDMLRASVVVYKAGNTICPTDEAFDQFEHVDASGIIRFLNKADLLGDGAQKAAQGLGELRNKYAHARGRDPRTDAIKALGLLHALVEGTVSVFKDFELTDKGLALKAVARST
jgi:hypothetical protein